MESYESTTGRGSNKGGGSGGLCDYDVVTSSDSEDNDESYGGGRNKEALKHGNFHEKSTSRDEMPANRNFGWSKNPYNKPQHYKQQSDIHSETNEYGTTVVPPPPSAHVSDKRSGPAVATGRGEKRSRSRSRSRERGGSSHETYGLSHERSAPNDWNVSREGRRSRDDWNVSRDESSHETNPSSHDEWQPARSRGERRPSHDANAPYQPYTRNASSHEPDESHDASHGGWQTSRERRPSHETTTSRDRTSHETTTSRDRTSSTTSHEWKHGGGARGGGHRNFYGLRGRDGYGRRGGSWDRGNNRDQYQRRDDRPYRGGFQKSRDYDDRRDFNRGEDEGGEQQPQQQQQQQTRNFQQPQKKKNFEETSLKLKAEVDKRKMLWQNCKEKKVADHWEAMLASCTDDKQAEKLKKLIGLKEQSGQVDSTPIGDHTTADDAQGISSVGGVGGPSHAMTSSISPTMKELTRQRQEELFRGLDQQYQLARMSTHTHRGMGLGFSSQMNEYAAQIQMAAQVQAFSAESGQQPPPPPPPTPKDHEHQQ